MEASEIEAEYAISYTDCFAIATAIRLDARILAEDSEFVRIEKLHPVDWRET